MAFHRIADVVHSTPQLHQFVGPPPAQLSGHGPKRLTVRISGPDSALIAEAFWRALQIAAERINKEKPPNLVDVKAREET